MNDQSDNKGSAAAKAATEFALLERQALALRAMLERLQQKMGDAEAAADGSQASHLMETNEQLVLSMLRAYRHAETSAAALDEATQSGGLDPLTSLPNRLLMLDRFTHAMATARRHGTRLALLFLDLNNFKEVNDTLGHAAGDEVLKQASQCLASLVRGSDTVSRHGGDEFLILLTEVVDVADAVLIAEKVMAGLSTPRRVDDHVVRITASVGISIFPDHGEDVAALIALADAAMYQAKQLGPCNCVMHGEAPILPGGLVLPALESMQRPVPYDHALAEHEHRLAQLREANQQLIVAALTAQELQAAAEKAHRRQTEFLAVVAHELRNPLAPIRVAATLMGKVDTAELPRLQGVIERQVSHMSRLLGDLLDVSRASTGKLRVESRHVELAGVIDQAIATCRPAMDVRLQKFSVQVPPCAPFGLHADPDRLAQIFSNLLDNASKYTPEGGTIALSVTVTDDAVAVTVSDSGIGITAEALPNIFEPFMQDRHAIAFNQTGLGIGLTVVSQLVRAHGGTLVATSAGPGKGSQFVVTLLRSPTVASDHRWPDNVSA